MTMPSRARPAPPCTTLGRHCRELELTLRAAELLEDGPEFHDGIATWLLGHTGRMTFGRPYVSGNRLVVDATVHVPCRHLRGGSVARCAAHGFTGPPPEGRAGRAGAPLRGSGERFVLVQDRRVQTVPLPARGPTPRALPTLDPPNPCAGAPCRTADNRRGAACCRDLTIDVVLPRGDAAREALLRARTAPYLCKVSRADDEIVECELISACGYLDADGVRCSLHGRTRPDGSPAKPSVCSDWPDLDPGERGHPGCRLVSQNGQASAGGRCPPARPFSTQDSPVPVP